MNVVKLNEYLSGNADAIVTILEKVGCENIRVNNLRDEIRCSRESGRNPSSVVINMNTLGYVCFSTNEKGSIYSLIMNKCNISFPNALKYVAHALNLEESKFNLDIKLPFGGFYKTLSKVNEEPELTMATYNDSVLNKYGPATNLMFLKDGIDLVTQNKYSLGYDFESDRIAVPQWNINGELVGIMGRSNDRNIPYEYRWLPILPCQRSLTLFGYHHNYTAIQERQLCVLTESEKGVMQMSSMGFGFGLATCGKNISKTQAKYIKALRVKHLVLAYDEGLDEDYLRFEAEKLKVDNLLYKSKVGYIMDKNSDILTKGSKLSPTDVGINGFRELVNKKIVWI